MINTHALIFIDKIIMKYLLRIQHVTGRNDVRNGDNV